jgi:hypothetical protein
MQCMQKTEVYSWRLSRQLKVDLEEAARTEQKSLADLLEQIAREWIERSRQGSGSEEEQHRRLREAAMKFVGAIEGGNPDRALHARSEVKARIARRRHGQ